MSKSMINFRTYIVCCYIYANLKYIWCIYTYESVVAVSYLYIEIGTRFVYKSCILVVEHIQSNLYRR